MVAESEISIETRNPLEKEPMWIAMYNRETRRQTTIIGILRKLKATTLKFEHQWQTEGGQTELIAGPSDQRLKRSKCPSLLRAEHIKSHSTKFIV